MPNSESRVLHFPADYSIGRIYISDNYVRERFFAEAQGSVSVPPRRKVKLSLTPNSSAEILQHLKSLKSDDIDHLNLEQINVEDNDLEPIYHLTGLQKLHLPFTKIDGSSFTKLHCFNELSHVAAWWSRVKDIGLQHLSSMQSLEILDVSRTQVTDEGARALVRARALRVLVLSDNRITDFAMTGFSSLPALQELHLGGTDLTDESVSSLGRMQNLVHLNIEKTKISQTGYERLRKLLPDCEIRYDNEFASANLSGITCSMA